MSTIFSRLFQNSGSGLIEDFNSFASFLAAAWDPSLGALVPGTAASVSPASRLEALISPSDTLPAIIAVSPAPEGASRPSPESLAAIVRLAVGFLDPELTVSCTAVLPFKSVTADLSTLACFVSTDGLVCLLLSRSLESGLKALLEELDPKALSKRLGAVLKASDSPDASVPSSPPSILAISDPWAARASRFFFPSSFAAGETSLRFVPSSFSCQVPSPAHPENETWVRFAVRGEGFQQGGVWVFTRPDSLDPAKAQGMALSVAKAAAAVLGQEYQLLSFPTSVTTSIAPSAPLNLGQKPLCTLEGSLSVGFSQFSVRISFPPVWVTSLSKAYGGAHPDPVLSFLILSRLLENRKTEPLIDRLSSPYQGDEGGGTASPVRFIPFFEVMGMAGEADYRKLAQNFLVRRYHRAELAELFFYRKTVQSESGPKRVNVRPQCFNLTRFSAALPQAVSEDFVAALKEGASAPTCEDFLRRNEAVYEAAMADLRSGALELSPRLGALTQGIYTRYVYPRKRRRLDSMVEKDWPFSALRQLPPRIVRAVVDKSDYQILAAAAIGHEENLEAIRQFCSKSKQENIRAELEHVQEALESGSANPDDLCTRRSTIMKKFEEVKERERKEREQERLRETVPTPPPVRKKR